MEVQVPGSKPSPAAKLTKGDFEEDWQFHKMKTLQAVLDQFQRALELLGTTTDGGDDDEEEEEDRDMGSMTKFYADFKDDEFCRYFQGWGKESLKFWMLF